MSDDDWEVQAPNWMDAMGEFAAGATVMSGAFAAMTFRDRGVPGDGHPVVLIPGLGAAPMAMTPLHAVVAAAGYEPHHWDGGFVTGYDFDREKALFDQVRDLHERTGRKVSLIGWSLGGAYARAAALDMPERVRQVTTLGTPFRGVEDTFPGKLYEDFMPGRMRDFFDPEVRERLESLVTTVEPPYTAVCSRSDGIAHFGSARAPLCDRKLTQTIEVSGPHFALPANPEVFDVIESILEVPEGDWRPHPRATDFGDDLGDMHEIEGGRERVVKSDGTVLHYAVGADGERRLHRDPDEGPAVEPPEGEGVYFVDGEAVPSEKLQLSRQHGPRA